jgi:hypothetical protein
VEHGYTCIYCGARWLCHDDGPFAGPSVCEGCVENGGPNGLLRAIPFRGTWVLERFAERAGDELRRLMRRGRAP